MKYYVLLLVISCFSLSYMSLRGSTTDLIQLHCILPQLAIAYESIEEKTLSTAPLSSEFYKKLNQAIITSYNQENDKALLRYQNHPSALIARYLIDETRKLNTQNESISVANPVPAQEIINLVEIGDSIRVKYAKEMPLIIASVASGRLEREQLILGTLHHLGYNHITFYAIDPDFKTTKAILEQWKTAGNPLANYTTHAIKNTHSYIETIITQKGEKPDVCLTFHPSLNEKRVQASLKDYRNMCTNKSSVQHKTLEALLIAPTTLKEIGVITGNSSIIESLRMAEIASPEQARSFSLKQFTRTFGAKNTICYLNVLLDFLEIIKVASTPLKECIAYSKSDILHKYTHIANKSITELYFESSAAPIHALESKKDFNTFERWVYNASTHHFEQLK